MAIKVVQDSISEELVFDLLENLNTREEFLINLKTVFEVLLRQKLSNPSAIFPRLIMAAIEKYELTYEQIKILFFLNQCERAIARNSPVEINELLYYYILNKSENILRKVLENELIIPERLFKSEVILPDTLALPDIYHREKYFRTLVVKNLGISPEKKYGKIVCRLLDGEIATILLTSPWDGFISSIGLSPGQIVAFYNIKRIEEKNLFISDKNSLMIFSPDYIIDVTDIKSCMNNLNDYLITRLCYTKKPSVKQIIGNAVNLIFDELLSKDSDSVLDNIPKLLCGFKFNLATVSSSINEIIEEVRFHVDNIIKNGLLDKIKTNGRYFIEPSFLSPEYGISGRIDVLYRDNNIIELKTGKPKDYGIWINDQSQTALYSLILKKEELQQTGKITVFYSKDKNPYRIMDVQYPISYIESVKRRNEMVNYDRQLASMNLKRMNDMRSILIDMGKSSLYDPYRAKIIELFSYSEKGSFKNLVQNYISEYISFSERERSFEKMDFSALWLKSEYQKRDEFRIAGPMKVEKIDLINNCISLFSGNNDSKFREGDICILYNKIIDISDQQLFRGSIKLISRHEIIITLRNKIVPDIFSKEIEWMLEGDYMDISSRKNLWACIDFLDCEEIRQKKILGLEGPRFKELDETILPPKIKNVAKQKEAIQRAVAAEDYFLIQGPPGTGKTTLLAHLINELGKNKEEKLLVVAFTNKAVDEIIRKIESETDLVENVIRLGNEYSTDFPNLSLNNRISSIDEKDIQEFLNSNKIFLSTIASASYNDIFNLVNFTTAIIDEASQITEPETLSVILRTKKFILIGDEKQLPAVISQNNGNRNVTSIRTTIPELNKIGIDRLDSSLFERLLLRNEENNWGGKILLDKQYRMHNSILQFSNINFYNSVLTSAENIPGLDINIGNKSIVNNIPIEFFDIRGHGEKKRNPKEAEIIVNLILKYQEALGAESASSMGVITPFRAQASHILQELLIKGIKDVKVDTVERFQGGEKDIIFISFAVYHHSQISQIQSRILLNNKIIDRKLNVALTRAKKKLIMAGNAGLLSRDSIFKELIAYIKTVGNFWPA